MSGSAFSVSFLAAAYVEAINKGGNSVHLREVLEKYDFDPTPNLIDETLAWWRDRGFREENAVGDKENPLIQLTDLGCVTGATILEVERLRPRLRRSAGMQRGSDSAAGMPTTISSEVWTGIERRLRRDQAAVDRIKMQVTQLDRDVETLDLTNRERAKVKAITEALTKLVESPEPEWKAIVGLLQSPTLTAILGLAGLTQLILKLIFGIG